MTKPFTPESHIMSPKLKRTQSLFLRRDIVPTRSRILQNLKRTRSLPSKYPANLYLNEETSQYRVKTDSHFHALHMRINFLAPRQTNSLINRLGRKARRKSALSMTSMEKAVEVAIMMEQEDEHSTTIRTQNLTACTPAPNGNERKKGPNNTLYELGPSFRYHDKTEYHEGKFFQEVSPKAKYNSDLLLSDTLEEGFVAEYFSAKQADKQFHFTVTKQGIQERAFQKRPITQKKAADGYSAADLFYALGVDAKETLSKYFHHAHRHGWGLSGPQIKENLDIATAGSNYTTLFYVEDVIRCLLNKPDIHNIAVTGDIEYHPVHTKLPIKITYTWQWGKR